MENIVIRISKPFVLGKCLCGCNEDIELFDKWRRKLRFFIHGHNWRGKLRHATLKKEGNYYTIKRQHHKFARKNGYVVFHHYLKELDEGCYFDPSIYDTHHKDGNTFNNEPENLEILLHSEHSSLTNKKDMSDRFCLLCNGKTRIDKNGWEYWIKYKTGYMCMKCYLKKYRNKKIKTDLSQKTLFDHHHSNQDHIVLPYHVQLP